MIDFRYHVVSLVAVFLALSTGIVIGATALRGEVAGTLSAQVGQLRQDKQQLRSELERAQQSGRRQNQYVGEVNPQALAGSLRGSSVVILALPGTPDGLIERSEASLLAAGASVTGAVRIQESLVLDPAQGRVRSAAAQMAMPVSTVPDNRIAGLVLAEAWTTRAGAVASAGQARARQTLIDAGALRATAPGAPSAQALVVLWPGRAADPARDASAELTGAIDLVTAVGLSGRPVVGVSSGAPRAPDSSDALVATLRNSAEATGAMSTVDDGDLAIGQGAMVLALRDEIRGRSGHFGVDKDAAAAAPAMGAS